MGHNDELGEGHHWYAARPDIKGSRTPRSGYSCHSGIKTTGRTVSFELKNSGKVDRNYHLVPLKRKKEEEEEKERSAPLAAVVPWPWWTWSGAFGRVSSTHHSSSSTVEPFRPFPPSKQGKLAQLE